MLLLGGTVTLTALVLVRFHGDFDRLLRTGGRHAAVTAKTFLAPELAYGGDWTSRFDSSAWGSLWCWARPGMPQHPVPLLHRAHRAGAQGGPVVWSISLIGGFYLMTIVLGFGAAALVGPGAVRASNAAGSTAVPLLALDLGGGAESAGGRFCSRSSPLSRSPPSSRWSPVSP